MKVKQIIGPKLSLWLYKKLKPLINYYYKGSSVYCLICKSSFKKFRAHGLPIRQNALCTSCNSLERHRLLYHYFKTKTDIFNPSSSKKVLHFAPEPFFYSILDQQENTQYYPCDIDPKRYNYGGQNGIQKIDVTDIPYADNTFDVIICNHVLEHVVDDSKAMKELYRVLKKNGLGIFQVPLDNSLIKTYEDLSLTTPEERLKAFNQIDHVRIYGKDYGEKLSQAGFNVKKQNYVSNFSDEEVFRFGFDKNEIIFENSKN